MTTTVTERRILEVSAGPLAELASDRVDEQAGVIRRVKVLGFHSSNKGRTIGLTREEFGDAVDKPYSYTQHALEQAKRLYEGAKVFSNHTEFGYDQTTGKRLVTGTDRNNDDLIGWLENVAIEGDGSKETDGMYADLCYVRSHPMATRLVEIARRRPEILALSHEAYWDDPQLRGGKIVLNVIRHVDCVPLVSANPGTTRGLFETAAPDATTLSNGVTKMSASASTKTTIKKLLESLAKDTKGHKRLLEMTDQYGAEMADVPVEVAAASSPEDQIKAGIIAAIVSKVESATPEQLEAVLKPSAWATACPPRQPARAARRPRKKPRPRKRKRSHPWPKARSPIEAA